MNLEELVKSLMKSNECNKWRIKNVSGLDFMFLRVGTVTDGSLLLLTKWLI